MLYGRRVIEPQRVSKDKSSRQLILNKSFQYKYAWYMVTAVAGGALIFLLPAFYFINQNYELLRILAYDSKPQLVQHLDMEVKWLTLFLGASLFFLVLTTLTLSIRITRSLLTPLMTIERHMHQLMLGQWHIPDYLVHEDEEFQDLAMTYEYFYRSLKANTEQELLTLEKLSIDPQNREAYAAWNHLINEKRARLGIKEELAPSENVANLSEFDRKRRAS